MPQYKDLTNAQQANARLEAREWLHAANLGPALYSTESLLTRLEHFYPGGVAGFLSQLAPRLTAVEQAMRSEHRQPPVGATAWCGYWRDSYQVLSHHENGYVTVQWSDGHTTHHCTPFDPYKDRILALPDTPVVPPTWVLNVPVATAVDALANDVVDGMVDRRHN